MKKFIANYPNRLLRERPTMAKPEYVWRNDTMRSSEYWNLKCKYDKHIASLKTYPASWLTPEMDGKVMVEGRDFKLQHQMKYSAHPDELEKWINISDDTYNESKEMLVVRIIALPIPADEKQSITSVIEFIDKTIENYKRQIGEHYVEPYFFKELKEKVLAISPSSPAEAKGINETDALYRRLRIDDILPPMDAVNKRLLIEAMSEWVVIQNKERDETIANNHIQLLELATLASDYEARIKELEDGLQIMIAIYEVVVSELARVLKGKPEQLYTTDYYEIKQLLNK